MSNIEITPEFQKLLDIVEEGREQVVFLTGRPGTGKSTWLKHFVKSTDKNVAICAPTGIAAINVGGVTIHSMFQFPPQVMTADKVKRIDYKYEFFNSLDVLVIDEISMVRVDMLDAIDLSLRLNRNSRLPFGGVQVICIGDPFQLPPVVTDDLQEFFDDNYKSAYFFDAKVFETVKLHSYELTKVFRQKDDPIFLNILGEIRKNQLQEESLNILNNKVDPAFETQENKGFVVLSSTNEIAKNINRQHLEAMKGLPRRFFATVTGDFPKDAFPTDELLILKTGLQVMTIMNDSIDRRWVNGSVGTIIEMKESSIVVDFGNYSHEVGPSTWEKLKYKYDKKNKSPSLDITGRFTQIPIKLAYAVTCHKGQGQTYEKVYIDLGRGAFAHGQTYVALSRCTSLDGIKLAKPIQLSDMILDEKVAEFMSRINTVGAGV